jgi:hypothetical protein
MQTHRMADPFRIPALPRKARRLPQPNRAWEALWEASLAGMLGLALAWSLAELALALGGH